MAKDKKLTQVACDYETKVEYGKKKILVDCEGCKKGEKRLTGKTCRASLTNMMMDEYNVNEIMLSGPIEKQYGGEGVDLIENLSEMITELRDLGQKDPVARIVKKSDLSKKDVKKLCQKCEKKPTTVFSRLEKEFKLDYGQFVRELRKEMNSSHNGKGKAFCLDCRKDTKEDCEYVLKESMALSDFILYSAFNIVVREDESKEKKKKVDYGLERDDEGEIVLTPDGPPKIVKPDKHDNPSSTLDPPPKIKPDHPPDKTPQAEKSSSRYDSPQAFYDSVNYRILSKGVDKILESNKYIRPSFSSSWLRKKLPPNSSKVEAYKTGNTTVEHYYVKDSMESIYYVSSEDYEVSEEEARLIELTVQEMSEKYPEKISMEDRTETKEYIISASRDIMRKLARRKGFDLGGTRDAVNKKLRKLSNILAKHTAGLGILEPLLKDKKVEDVYVDAPAPANPLYVELSEISDEKMDQTCRTNLILGKDDIDSLLSRFRMESGRPFSESDPVLEYNMEEFDIRVTIIGEPLSPQGAALALRRHSEDPWTLLRLIANNTLTPLAAGLFSFLIGGRSTILVAGSRGAGKTSLLSALMLEFPTSQRLLAIEDTQELPTRAMQEKGYKVQNILVGSETSETGYEKSPKEALRVSLRLGESAIIMGEVRGEEAKTLYEAMRAGTAGSSVLGTFHANSPNSVYERAVYDIGVPSKSFLATDVVAVANLKRPGGRQKPVRKLSQISELDKEADEEGSFRDLMMYDSDKNKIVETDVMKYSSQIIGRIARQWDMSLDEAYDNIRARARYREMVVQRAKQDNLPELLSAEWVKKTNSVFWKRLDEEQRRGGGINYDKVLREWKDWFEESAEYA